MTALTAVLLPGLDGTGDLFGPFVAAAPQGINTVVVSYPSSEASIDVLAEHARSQLPDRCIVIAESFSGPIGVRVAADDRVQALVLCNSFVSTPIFPTLRHFVMAPFFAVPIPRSALRFFLLGPHANQALIESVRATLRQVPASIMARRIRQTSQIDERRAVGSLRKPILYLRGVSDNLMSERSWKDLRAIRPDAEIARIRGPHLLLQVSPAECWRAILGFVEKLATGEYSQGARDV